MNQFVKTDDFKAMNLGFALDEGMHAWFYFCIACNISNTSDSVSSGYPNTEKRVENTTRSGVFLTKFEVFG